MANMREIRGRIRSVKSTQQITRAMKMVSVAKLRRAQSGMDGMEQFTAQCRVIMSHLPADAPNPFLQPRRQVKNVCYVLFVGNRGLCGTYNHAVVRYAKALLEQEKRPAFVVAVGRWGRDVIEDAGLPVRETFTDFGDMPSMDEAIYLAACLKKLYLAQEADEVHLIYQHYHNSLLQTPTDIQLLPAKPERGAGGNDDYLFEPTPEAVLRHAVELYINCTVFSVLKDAKVGEQAARMTAMGAATDATTDLIDELTLALNQARQAAITTEIAEVVGGANALKNGGARDTVS